MNARNVVLQPPRGVAPAPARVGVGSSGKGCWSWPQNFIQYAAVFGPMAALTGVGSLVGGGKGALIGAAVGGAYAVYAMSPPANTGQPNCP